MATVATFSPWMLANVYTSNLTSTSVGRNLIKCPYIIEVWAQVIHFCDFHNGCLLASGIWCSCFSGWPSWDPDIGQSQCLFDPTENSAIRDCYCRTHFPCHEELFSLVFPVFGVRYVLFYEPHWAEAFILCSSQCYYRPMWMVGLGIPSPIYWLEVTESSVTCIAFGIILTGVRSDGPLTVARAMIITALSVRQVSFKADCISQTHNRSIIFLSSKVSA